ncbi:type IV pilus assembly protein PilN [Clostridium cavendishii DSM 21758]|uniref:Type IV pilus assembly protein PilN n=1 Tax=Clostridium cavendishii DSM 21758 TaxID=1121302 RepID=A0A1M6LJD5_9CLOT|nr:PilN domain-containing protein [Clostridium cavendishii]SHJ71336.1 type IV pilus assembly protein PilN [Clostridium cavendishii DSM 21758]
MTDFNFFEPYLATNKPNSSVKWVAIAGGTMTALFIVSTLAVNSYQIMKFNNDIKDTEAKIADSAFQMKLKKSEDLLKKKGILNKYDQALTSINYKVKNRAIVTPNFMVNINGAIPEGVFFDSISVEGSELSITARSKTRKAIGEFQHNLKGVSFITNAFVDGIASDLAGSATEEFSFTVKCDLKEDFSDESK